MLCQKSRAARELELEGKLPTEAELALLVDNNPDNDPDQGGVDTNAFSLKMIHYRNRNPKLIKAKARLKRCLDLVPGLQGAFEHEPNPKRKKMAKDKRTCNKRSIKAAKTLIAKEEGITGDSAMDALLD